MKPGNGLLRRRFSTDYERRWVSRRLRRLELIRLELASIDVVGVLLDVGVPLLGKGVQSEDCRHGADRNTGSAVDALDRVDEELIDLIEHRPAVFILCIFFRMDTVHGAGVYTGCILGPYTGFCNDIRHVMLRP